MVSHIVSGTSALKDKNQFYVIDGKTDNSFSSERESLTRYLAFEDTRQFESDLKLPDENIHSINFWILVSGIVTAACIMVFSLL